jgi:2-succinyl-5-enolpyruvyl-6-hydroxy-3-cyclohexene-1-carboxylate synthase
MLVCTADRPPELQDVGAPQAIRQDHLFGHSVRWFHAPGVATAATQGRWRPLAGRALAEASGPAPGPVHLNLAFREPLVGRPSALPPVTTGLAHDPTHRGGPAAPDAPPGPPPRLLDDLVGRRGVFVAGPDSGPGPLLHDVARALGWPVLAAPQAAVWSVPGAVVPAADAVLRTPWLAETLRPEVVVRLGLPLASKVVGEWVAASGATEIAVAGPGRWIDPHGTADLVLAVTPSALLAGWAEGLVGVEPTAEGTWLQVWTEAGAGALAAVDAVLDGAPTPTEPGVARDVVAALPSGAALVVSSSMPIRDVEWFARPRPGLRIHANRGANGIDGVVSTAVGVAVGSTGPTALLIGDVAFLHDSNGLLGAAARDVDLVIVVVDNDGGGIFSFLPQADLLDPAPFEALFGTPHGLDLVALAAAYGADARPITGDVGPAVAAAVAAGGVQVLVVRTRRDANVELHALVQAAVARALDPDR